MTNPITASSHIGVSTYASAQSLSGEALLTYISTRLSSFDSEINAHMSSQNKALSDKENLQHLKNFQGKLKASKEGGEISSEELDQAKAELYSELEDDPALQKEAKALFEGDDHGDHSVEALQVQIDETDTKISQVTSNSEITMIRLQQLMSQRQTSVQLTTNVLSKYNQGDESIIGNIR